MAKTEWKENWKIPQTKFNAFSSSTSSSTVPTTINNSGLPTHETPMVAQGTITSNYAGFQDISPVTLVLKWPTLGRMLLCLGLAFVGSLMNGFHVAAFFIEDSLKTVGNVFICMLGLVDLAVTGIVIPISVIVLLSGEGDNVTTCHYQQMIVTAAAGAYVLFYMLVSAEYYVRVTHMQRRYLPLTSMRVGLVSTMVISISLALAAVGTFLGMDYDFCERLHSGNMYYRFVTGCTFYLIPVIVTTFHLFATAVAVRRRARESHYRRSQQYDQDTAHATHNIIVYMVFIGSWAPYAITIYFYPDMNNKKFYSLAWIGVTRTVFSSAIYSFVNRSFRRAYAHLFNYCCCKSTLSSSFTGRHRRALDYRPPSSDVRVHIMHKAMNVHSPQRAVAAYSDTQEL